MKITNCLRISILSLAIFTFQGLANEAINANYEKALIAFNNDKFSDATIHLKNIIKENPGHMPSRVLMAQLHIKQGNGAAAQVELDRAREGQVDNDRLITLYAKAYLLQGEYDEVIKTTSFGQYNEQITRELLLLKGQAYIGNKQYKQANRAFSDLLKSQPKHQFALLGKAQLALNDSQIEQALKYIELSVSSAKPFINGWILKSKILHRLGNRKGALAAIDQALEINEKHLSARLTKAMLHIELNEYQLALPHVDYILVEIPNEPRAGYLKAIINASLPNDNEAGLDDKHKLTDVIATLAAVPPEIMKITPDYYFLAGLTNFQYGNLNDAYRYLTQYLSYVESDIDSVRMLAAIDIEQGQLDSAKNLLRKTNVDRPGNPDILTLLGLTYLQLEQNDKAQFYFKQVVDSYPTSSSGIGNLARSKMQAGDYSAAIEALSAIKDNDINSVQIKLLLIDAYQKTQKYSLAIETAKALIIQYPKDSYFQQRIGTLYGLNGQLLEARSSFEKSLVLNPKNIVAIIHLARMDNISGEHDKALQLLQSKLVVFAENATLMSELSDSYLFKQDIDNAYLWIQKSYSQDPNKLETLRKFSHILTKQKKLSEAVDLLDEYIGLHPKKAEPLLLISRLYQKQNKHKKAILALRDYVEKSRNKAKALTYLAKAQLSAKEKDGAIKSYKQAIIANDRYLPAYLGLVKLTIKNKNESFSLSLISSIEDITNDKGLTFTLKGDLYNALMVYPKAINYYKDALKTSDRKQAVLGLYSSYRKAKQISKAIPPLQEWLKQHPNDIRVSIALADSYKGSEQLQKAADYYQELIKQHGALPILLNNSAGVEMTLGNLEAAKALAQQAYGYLPENIAIIDTLAWIKSRMGEYKEAVALFRIALTKDFDNAEIKYHLAVTLFGLSRDTEAKRYLAEAIDSEQQFPEKDDARTLFKTKSP